MALFDASVVDVILLDDDNLVAVYKNVMLQVRVGQMSRATLDYMNSAARLMRARMRGQTGALISVVEESAEVPSGEVRKAQMEAMGRYLGSEDIWLAAIITAGGARGALMRATVRMLGAGRPRLGVFGHANEAAAWLAGRLPRPSASEQIGLVDWGRERMRAELGSS